MDKIILSNVEDFTSYQKTSVSEINSLRSSTLIHSYAYRQGLEPKDTPSYFTKGTYLHKLMENHLLSQAHGFGSALDELTNIDNQILQERGVMVVDSDKNQLLDQYTSWVQSDDSKWFTVSDLEDTPFVEIEFYVDVGWKSLSGDTVLGHGVIDAVVEEVSSGSPWILEHKTAGRAWAQSQYQFDFQGRFYEEAVARLTEHNPVGTAYNFFLPKRTETKMVYHTQQERQGVLDAMQKLIWLRDSGSITYPPANFFGWGAYKELAYAELMGEDTTYLRATKFNVNQDKVDRFSEEES